MDDRSLLFTVVIPVRNRATELKNAIQGVLEQVFGDFEVIVVDDGSEEAIESVVGGFDDERLRLLRQDPIGVSAARNHGAGSARGRFLVFLDSDDRPSSHWLESFAESIEASDAQLVMCAGTWIDAKGGTTLIPIDDLGPEFNHQRGLYLAGTFAISRTLFEEVGGYDERMTYSENHELFLRVIPFCQENGFRIVGRSHPQLQIKAREESRRYDWEKYESMKLLVSRHGERLRLHPRMLANLLAVRGVTAARLGHLSEARRAFISAYQAQPSRLVNLARLLFASTPAIARLVWGTVDDKEPGTGH